MTIQPNDKIWDKAAVVELLETNDRAVVKAIKGLYARQTASEQSRQTTIEHNGRGFNSRDAGFLSDIARKLPRYNDNMTRRQLAASRKMLRKYWRQLLEMIEEQGGKTTLSTKPPKGEIAKPQIREVAIAPLPEDALTLSGEFKLPVTENPLWGAF